jgi:hypothetical protein
MIVLILALALLDMAWPNQPDSTPEPEPQPIPRDLDDGYATTAACHALDTWWDQAYGGVATEQEMQ